MIEKMILSSMIIQQHYEIITFDIVFMTKHDIVLKIFCLKKTQFRRKLKKKSIYMKKTSKNENFIHASTKNND